MSEEALLCLWGEGRGRPFSLLISILLVIVFTACTITIFALTYRVENVWGSFIVFVGGGGGGQRKQASFKDREGEETKIDVSLATVDGYIYEQQYATFSCVASETSCKVSGVVPNPKSDSGTYTCEARALNGCRCWWLILPIFPGWWDDDRCCATAVQHIRVQGTDAAERTETTNAAVSWPLPTTTHWLQGTAQEKGGGGGFMLSTRNSVVLTCLHVSHVK